MKLVYGTTNPGKLQYMKDVLKGLDVRIVGLGELAPKPVVNIDETGNNPLDNARIKSLAYFDVLQTPVFSCDSGLYIEGLNTDNQPGVHVRRVNGRELNDEEMLEYYSNLAHGFGGTVKARYRNAICLVVDRKTVYEYDGDDIASEDFLLTSKPHPARIPGFPLDSLSLESKTGRYYLDLEDETDEDNAWKTLGFRRFFVRTVLSGCRDII